jgi:hypothetical protein
VRQLTLVTKLDMPCQSNNASLPLCELERLPSASKAQYIPWPEQQLKQYPGPRK